MAVKLVLDCRVEYDEDLAVVHLTGAVDDKDIPAVRSSILDCLAVEPAVVVLDMAQLAVVSDAATGVFTRLARQAAAWPGSVVAFAAPPRAFLAAYDAPRSWVYPTVAAARSACASVLGRARRVHRRLAPAPAAAPVARQLVIQACRRWGVALAAQNHAELVVTELVSNAVRHAGTPIDLSISLRPGRLQISVRDRSTVHPPRPRPPELTAESGRGLMLISSLCASCGSTPMVDGKVVWAAMPVSGAGSTPSTGNDAAGRDSPAEPPWQAVPPV